MFVEGGGGVILGEKLKGGDPISVWNLSKEKKIYGGGGLRRWGSIGAEPYNQN